MASVMRLPMRRRKIQYILIKEEKYVRPLSLLILDIARAALELQKSAERDSKTTFRLTKCFDSATLYHNKGRNR